MKKYTLIFFVAMVLLTGCSGEKKETEEIQRGTINETILYENILTETILYENIESDWDDSNVVKGW